MYKKTAMLTPPFNLFTCVVVVSIVYLPHVPH
jgi:hypothetical protein